MQKDKTHSISLTWFAVLAAIAFAAAIRIRLLGTPLERDEGEYAYIAQLILQGIPPYLKAYSMKFPGIYLIYAMIMSVLGQTVFAIHTGLLIANAAATVLIFRLARRLFDASTGAIAGVSFAILSLSPAVNGLSANAEHFILVPVIGGILLLLKGLESGRTREIFLSGSLLGLALIIKQHSVFFILFGAAYLLYSSRKVTRFASFSLGTIIPLALTFLALLWTGAFEKFWFWAFKYAYEYVNIVSPSEGAQIFKTMAGNVVNSAPLLWGIVLIGLTALYWDGEARKRSFFVLGFLIASLIAICPGLYFRPHYFVLILPAAALLIGIAVSSAKRLGPLAGLPRATRLIPFLFFALAIYSFLWRDKGIFFKMTPDQVSRMTYGANPFLETLEIARYIKANSEKKDRIAVIGSEPQIFFYANRLSATGYLYTYGLTERQRYALKMQKEMLGEIESAGPKYIVWVNIHTSGAITPESEKLMLDWLNTYCRDNFDRVGAVDLLSMDLTEYRWGKEAETYSPRSTHFIYVFRKKSLPKTPAAD